MLITQRSTPASPTYGIKMKLITTIAMKTKPYMEILLYVSIINYCRHCDYSMHEL